MNEDVKKNLRTQGKYSDGPNNRDKRQKESPTYKEPSGKIKHARKRNSNDRKEENNSVTDEIEDESPITYQENSAHSFSELEDFKKPIEISSPGLQELSKTGNGESLILYEPEFIRNENEDIFNVLLNTTCWYDKNIVIRGEEYPQPRLVAWYGPFPYTYSGVTLEPAEMPGNILRIKKQIEDYLLTQDIEVSFNSVLLNCYRSGKDSVSWHSDDELSMAVSPTIASISLGETRKFEMRRKKNSYEHEVSNDDIEKYFINLTHGSLLIMTGCMQLDWQHRVPKEYHDKSVRINLTFRTVYPFHRNPEVLSKDVKEQSEKCSNVPTPINNEIIINEEEFPPLSRTLNSISLDTEESKHMRPQSSNLSLNNNEDANKSMEDVPNDLKDSIKSEYDINKSVSLDDSDARDSDISIVDHSMEKDQSFDNSMNVPNEPSCINPPLFGAPPVNIEQRTLPCTVDNFISTQKSNHNLNAYAPVFIPSTSPVPSNQENVYGSFNLGKLLEYNTRAMNDDILRDYTYALKEKVMEFFEEYDYFVKDNLNFLNDLMEETQSIRTQRLITERMHKLACESFDELDYSSNSGHNSKFYDKYSGQYGQGEFNNSYRGKGRFRGTRSNRNEMHYRTTRQNVRGGYINTEEIDSSRAVSQRGKGNSNRSYSNREKILGNKKGCDTNYSGRGDRNSNKDYSNQEELADKEDWGCITDKSGENKSFNRDISDSRHMNPNKEKDNNQKEISDRRDCSLNGERRNFGRRERQFSNRGRRGREYSNQEIPNRVKNQVGQEMLSTGRPQFREESQANQEESSSRKGQYSKEGFSNKERSSGKGYSRSRKEFLTQGKENTSQQ